MATADTDDWRPVMRMYADFRYLSGKHPDLATFHRRRYEAYCERLGIDLEAPMPRADGRDVVQIVLRQFADRYRLLKSPFSNYLEAPQVIVDLYNVHGGPIGRTYRLLEQQYLDVMVDCANQLWGPCPRAVTDADLHSLGVGRADESEELDYW